jgi:hypothetical protein
VVCWSEEFTWFALTLAAAENRAVQERWIAVASGFDIGSEHYNEQRLQMLVEYLSGELTERTTSNDVSKISRLLLIGNSLVSPTMSVPLDSTLEAVDTKAVSIVGCCQS